MSAARLPVLAFVALAASAGSAQAPATSTPAEAKVESTALFWNAHERTAAALGRLDGGDPPGAAGAFDTAWRLRPDDPIAAFNSGTGRLLAGRPEALPALEAAARALAEAETVDGGARELAPDAFFNLGNARLAAGDAAGAVEAYAETLRRTPRREDAKRNLELALRALEQRRQQQSPGSSGRDDDTRNDEAGGQAPQTGAGEGDPRNDEDRTDGESREGGESDSQPGSSSGNAPNGTGDSSSPTDATPTPPSTESPPSSPESSSSAEASSSSPDTPPSSRPAAAGSRRQERLPGFVDQPEMTAEQAAALLDAVEDLERQQRRQRALERARRRPEVEKDW